MTLLTHSLAYIQKRWKLYFKKIHTPNVHSSNFYNSQITLMSIDRWMLIDNMVYIHNVKLLRIKKNEVMPFASLVAQRIKHFLYCRRPGFDPCVGKIPWRRKWQSIPVFLPGESHGQRSLAGRSPQGHKESDTTERLHTHTVPFAAA